MDTVGITLKKARTRKKVSKQQLSVKTKIKEKYIQDIEEENWANLPDYPVVQGFVKNISSYLGIGQDRAIALLRRDYPPIKVSVNPKPDYIKKLTIKPQLLFGILISVFVLIIITYLLYQYLSFIKPPDLQIEVPVNGQIVTDKSIIVKGKTTVDATVRVNNQPVFVDEFGNFSFEEEVIENSTVIRIDAISRSGKVRTIERHIKVEL